MSKKQQKNKVKPVELKIVDQQKEPCLRALQKKVRNANKKLADISQLQDKKDLKPQQIQKVNRKEQIISQRDKFLEFIELYTSIVAQNEKIIRKNQLVELEDLAIVIAVDQYDHNENKKQSQQINVLKNNSSNLSLTQRATQLTQTLTSLANNTKLKERAKKYYEQNQNKKIEEPDEKVQKVEQVKEPEQEKICQLPVQQQSILQQPQEKIKQIVSEQKIEEIKDQPEKVQEKVTEEVKEQEKTPEQQNKPQQEKQKRQDKRKYHDNDKKKKNYRDYDKNYKNKNYQNNKKPTFKPKYQEKTKDAQEISDRSSSQEVKTFRREDIKKLEDEGFIVVGKPKIKARDQKEYHEHQHGRYHPNQQQRNQNNHYHKKN